MRGTLRGKLKIRIVAVGERQKKKKQKKKKKKKKIKATRSSGVQVGTEEAKNVRGNNGTGFGSLKGEEGTGEGKEGEK